MVEVLVMLAAWKVQVMKNDTHGDFITLVENTVVGGLQESKAMTEVTLILNVEVDTNMDTVEATLLNFIRAGKEEVLVLVVL